MSLKYFIINSAIKKQYRSLLRLAKKIKEQQGENSKLGQDIIQEIRKQFRAFDNTKSQKKLDEVTLAMLLKTGQEHIEFLKSFVQYETQSPNKTKSTISNFSESIRSNMNLDNSKNLDNTVDRGRLGIGWPWKHK